MKKQRVKKALTLIEIIMAMLVVAILAVTAIPRVMYLRQEAISSACQADVGSLRSALNTWYTEWAGSGVCPSGHAQDCHQSGFPVSAQLQTDNSFFAQNYFSDRTLPPTNHITGDDPDWSYYYAPDKGEIDMAAACP